MNRKSKEFKELQKEWYKKLKDSGFRDVEKNERELIAPSEIAPETFEETVAYYRMARRFLEDHDFVSPFNAAVWFLHCEGLSAREIAREFRRSNSTISTLVSLYESKMLKR